MDGNGLMVISSFLLNVFIYRIFIDSNDLLSGNMSEIEYLQYASLVIHNVDHVNFVNIQKKHSSSD